MSIVIGCSGSTGSSLLKTMLNRHSQLFAGPEAALFAFPQVYEDWQNCKSNLLRDIKNDAWQMRKGMQLLQPAFAWDEASLKQLIAQSDSFLSFVNDFFSKPLQRDNKQIWLAKTPANAAGLKAFLKYSPEGKVLQTLRNPYDTIASLMARGLNAYAATAYYVYNTAIATSNLGHERYYHLKYEDLVNDPAQTLQKLFEFLKIPFELSIIKAQHEIRAEPAAMKGWKHQETAPIQKSSINRFQELDPFQQDLIKTAFATFRIRERYVQSKDLKYQSGEELCAVLDYEYDPISENKYSFLLKKYLWRDRFSRLKHGFGWQFMNYMGKLD